MFIDNRRLPATVISCSKEATFVRSYHANNSQYHRKFYYKAIIVPIFFNIKYVPIQYNYDHIYSIEDRYRDSMLI